MFDGIGLFSRFQPTEGERKAPVLVLLTAVSNTADLRQQYQNSNPKHIRCDVNQPKKQLFTITACLSGVYGCGEGLRDIRSFLYGKDIHSILISCKRLSFPTKDSHFTK